MFPMAPQGTQVINPPPVGPEPPGLAEATTRAFDGTLPAPPDPYADDTKLLKTFDDFKEESFDRRWTYERVWWRNLLYFMGRQWIYYDQSRSSWQDKRMAKWIPRPVTNKIEETTNAILAVFQSVQLGVDCQPAGGTPEDVTTAETANKYELPIRAEHLLERKEPEADFWLITTGNVIRHVWWDKSGGSGLTLVPYEQCQGCGEKALPPAILQAGGMCPSCGQGPMQVTTDAERVYSGKGCTDISSPFEYAFPLTYASFDELPGIIRKRWRSKQWCQRNLPPEVVKTFSWESVTSDRSLQLLKGLATLNDTTVPTNAGAAGGDIAGQEGITEYELWLKPTPDYPKGLFLRVIGEGDHRVLRLPDQSVPGPLPYLTEQGEPLFPFVHTPYERVAGRIWGRAPLDSLIQKQDQLNQVDSLIQLIIQRTANPIWLEPKGAEVKKFTGEPGLVVRYQPSLAGNGAKPERLEGQNVPASLFQLRQQYLADIESLSGTFDIIKGQKPTGVEAFSALQLLVERSQSRYGPVLAARGESYRQWFSLALELERQYGPEERLFAILGPNQRWTVQTFKQADLQGSIRILVEDGSNVPKTSLGKRAAIEQLKNLGVINPLNPDTGYAILKSFGQTDLWPGLDYDVRSALQEQYDFEQWATTAEIVPQMQPVTDPMTGQPAIDPLTGQPAQQEGVGLSSPPPIERKVWHNDAVHAAEHRKWANSDAARQLLVDKPWIEPYVGWMIEQHDYYLQQQAMMEAGGPEASGPAPGGLAMANSNAESGNPGDVPSGESEATQGQGPQ